jgi:hypothetical protein
MTENFFGAEDTGMQAASVVHLFTQLQSCLGPLRIEARWVLLEGDSSFDNGLSCEGFKRRYDVNGKREPVEQLWPQQAFLRVHAAEQDKLSRMGYAKTLSLNSINPACGRIEQCIAQMGWEKVNFIDIKNSAVSFGQEARLECGITLEGPLQVQASKKPVLSGPDWKIDERRGLWQESC